MPHQGCVAISVNMVTGIIDPTIYRWATWLAGNKEPVEQIGYGYIVNVHTSSDIMAMQQADSACAENPAAQCRVPSRGMLLSAKGQFAFVLCPPLLIVTCLT